jgi:hypothetical protein
MTITFVRSGGMPWYVNNPKYFKCFNAIKKSEKINRDMIMEKSATIEFIIRPFKKNNLWRNFSGRS